MNARMMGDRIRSGEGDRSIYIYLYDFRLILIGRMRWLEATECHTFIYGCISIGIIVKAIDVVCLFERADARVLCRLWLMRF